MRTKKIKVATGRDGLATIPERVKSMEEIEAQALFAKFGTEDKNEYTQRIDKMSDFDLSTHAQTVNVRPVSERSRIRAALLSAFENARARAGNISRASAVEVTSVSRQITDNYEDFISKFRPA